MLQGEWGNFEISIVAKVFVTFLSTNAAGQGRPDGLYYACPFNGLTDNGMRREIKKG